jgi:hypothetical protein
MCEEVGERGESCPYISISVVSGPSGVGVL